MSSKGHKKRSSGHSAAAAALAHSTSSTPSGSPGPSRRRHRHSVHKPVAEMSKDELKELEEHAEIMEQKLEALTVVEADDSDDSDVPEENLEETAEKLKKQGFWFRKKKGLVGKLSTSTLGGALFKKYMDEETVSLIALAKGLATDYKDKETAEKLHRRIMRVATKTLMLYDNKTFTGEEFAKFRVPFRKICAIVKNNFARDIWDDKVVDRLSELITEIVDGLEQILKKHVSDKTVGKMEDLRSFFAHKPFIVFAHDNVPVWKRIVEILSYYLEET